MDHVGYLYIDLLVALVAVVDFRSVVLFVFWGVVLFVVIVLSVLLILDSVLHCCYFRIDCFIETIVSQPFKLLHYRCLLTKQHDPAQVNVLNHYFQILVKLEELALLWPEILQMLCFLIQLHKKFYFLLFSWLVLVFSRVNPQFRFWLSYLQWSELRLQFVCAQSIFVFD